MLRPSSDLSQYSSRTAIAIALTAIAIFLALASATNCTGRLKRKDNRTIIETREDLNVLDYCKSDCVGVHECDMIQAAIDSAIQGVKVNEDVRRRIKIPAGRYLLREPLVIRDACGIALMGDGPALTELFAEGVGTEGKPIILLINCSDILLEGIRIAGDPNHVSTAAIESRVDNKAYNFRLWPTDHTYRFLTLGSRRLSPTGKRPPPGMKYGIRFTAADTSDGNNDQAFIQDVSICNFIEAAISIEHGNSLMHRIVGGVHAYGKYAVQVAGGSFQMMATNIFVDECDFVFDPPTRRRLRTPDGKSIDTSCYYHASTIVNVASEGESNLIRTAAWPEGPYVRENGRNGINVKIIGYDKSGVLTHADLNPLGTAIDFRSDGHLSISSSHLNFGRPTSIFIGHPDARVSMTGNYVSHIYKILALGTLQSIGNYYSGGPLKLEKKLSGSIVQIADENDWRGRN